MIVPENSIFVLAMEAVQALTINAGKKSVRFLFLESSCWCVSWNDGYEDESWM